MEAKKMIGEQLNKYLGEFMIVHNNIIVMCGEDGSNWPENFDKWVLPHLGIVDGTELLIIDYNCYSLYWRAGAILPDGRKVRLINIQSNFTVRMVKQYIENSFDYDANRLIILFKGRMMEDDKLLSDYEVSKDSVI